ncbi:hypothetical protein GON03_22980 [Nocardioides sp. MAH-18]|uniref:Uncharacterized protein n=1 Tax=Nocardioides agri TaxID=2682843 RepID=A0A6L6Y060_9ACTN|nr:MULTISPECIES: hypothetical protein [unclassified Nocardioides]MBA2952894.1 hypothetical protein [Nocardioides sp. CGMCC 1.13656]MVQ52056.1 hypothetical protein [Nocardioides sp. MAH-18]
MHLGLGLVVVVALAWAIAARAARSRGARAVALGAERRLQHLRARREVATRLDVETILRTHPLPEATVHRVTGTLADRRISWPVAWRWADRFGSDKLVLAVDADVAEARLRRHLDAGTTPDWDAMTLFAGLNRGPLMPMAEVLDPGAAPEPSASSFDAADWEVLPEPGTTVPEVDLSQFGHRPPVYDPGLPVTRTSTPPPGGRPLLADELDPEHPTTPGGDNDWPQVA